MELVVFSLNYSSWSVRAWLALDHAGVAFELRHIGGFVEEGWRDRLLAITGAAKVPVLLDGKLTVHESLAICEYCLLYTSPSPRDRSVSRMPSSA